MIIIKVRTRKKQIGIKIDESSQSMTENDDKSRGIITIEYKKNVKIKSIKSLIYIVVLSGISMWFSHFIMKVIMIEGLLD